jgi:DNA mismatch repair protein MutH
VNNAGLKIAFALLALWAAAVVLDAPALVVETQPAAPVASHRPPLESLFVSSATPTVVIVADLASEYGTRWMEENAPKLREKGWKVQSVDLEGSSEVRFYVRAMGQWRVHSGHMSLNGLKAMLDQ